MSDTLLVGGGGSTAVATDDLFEQAQALERLRQDLVDCRRRLAGWPFGEEIDARVTQSVLWAAGAIDEAAAECEDLAAGLRRSAERYGALERSLSRVQRDLGADAAYVAGMVLPGLVALHGPAIALGLLSAAAGVTIAAGGPDRAGAALLDWLRANPRVTNNALVAGLVRTGVSSIDDFGMGAVYVPPSARAVLGEKGLGLLGVPETGAVLMAGAAGWGVLRETPVRVHRVGDAGARSSPSPRVAAPRGFGDLAARVPSASPGGAQVRIERYTGAGGTPRYVVYVGGMVDSSMRSRREPWDATSSVRAVTGQDAGAVRAVESAMKQAGIGSRDPVLITGYSLGGVAAREVTERGGFTVSQVVTLGSPVGQAAAPDGVPVVTVEHTEDVLAALGGHPPAGDETADPLVVRRSVMDADRAPSDTVFAAHALEDYRHTAELMDSSEEARLVASREGVATFLEGTTAESVTYWRADRVIPDAGTGTELGTGSGLSPARGNGR
ncbi:alpha/beta hydrolase family protein [Planctomonas psychrotolerans]|uniref:hypothetical protein n=1 Tax=Planctomonas psychrotolerans TaxID=2528712 RepID=UPI001239AAD8|nr:hypothetical protein [Planctomonas psychrotolerans]